MTDNEIIIRFLQRHRRRYLFSYCAGRISTALFSTLVLCLVLTIVFAIFPLTVLPLLLNLSFAGSCIYVLSFVVYHVYINPPSLIQIAGKLEQASKRPHQWLSLSLELPDSRSSSSPSLSSHIQKTVVDTLKDYPVSIRPLIDNRWVIPLFIILPLLCILSILIRPNIFTYWNSPYKIYRDERITISPGKISIAFNSSCTLSCVPQKNIYPSARLFISPLSANSRHNRYLLRPGTDNSFSYFLDSLRESFTYHFTLGTKSFPEETVTVVMPPRLRILQVTLFPPPYTGSPSVTLPDGRGNISAYPGTLARFLIGSHFPLKNAFFLSDKDDKHPLKISDTIADGIFELKNPMRYSFSLEDIFKQNSDSLPWYNVDIIPDIPPSVRFLKPGTNKSLSQSMNETLWVEGIDDFGIRRLAYQFKKNTGSSDAVITREILPSSSREKIVRAQFLWDLSSLSLYPGDTVFYWAIARDNKPFGAPQIAVSDTFWFRVPSFREIHESIAEKESDAQQSLEKVRDYQESLKDKLEQVMRSSKGKKELSWEEKKILEDVGENLKSQVDSLSQAVSSLQQAVQQMKELGTLSPEMVDKMNEVSESIKKLIEQYGDSVLFQPPKTDDAVTWQDMKKSVEKLKDLLPDFQQHLDNTLKFLERLRKDQELARLASGAENLAQRQLEQISDQQKKNTDIQEKLLEEIKDLSGDIDKAGDKDNNDRVLDKESLPSLDQLKALEQAMREQLKRKQILNNNEISQMSGTLQSLSNELSAMLSTAMMAQMLKDRDRLLNMARDILDISKWQKQTTELSRQSQNKSLSATQQQAIRDALRKSLENLDSLMSVPPNMMKSILNDAEKALSAMNNSLSSMSGGLLPGEPSGGNAGVPLNSLTSTLLSSAEGMGQQGQGSCPTGQGDGEGLLPGLRKLSGKQAAINTLTSQLLQQMLQQDANESGTNMGKSSESAAKTAQEAQKQLGEEIKRLADAYGKEAAEGATEKKMKELEEEARRLAKMLENPTQDIPDRQEKFLVRLLQTSLSMHKQDQGKEERKSTSATVIFQENLPQDGHALSGDMDSYYRIRTRALGGNFPESYRANVQAYFDSLGVLFLKPSN